MKSSNKLTIPVAFLFSALLLAACGPSGDNFRIEGRIRGMQGGEIFVCIPSAGEDARFDTLAVQDERFTYAASVTEPTPMLLIFPNGVEQVVIVAGGQALRYEAQATDLANYTVKGSEENKYLNDFRQGANHKDARATRARAKRYIQRHPEYTASLWLFSRYYVQDSETDVADMRPLLQLLRKHHPTSRSLIDAAKGVQTLGRGREGSKLPHLTVTTQRKRTFQLDQPRRPHTVLFFWATWMPKQWENFAMLRHLQSAHGEELDVVAFSLDTQIYRWEEDTKSDSLRLQHVCDGQAFGSPFVRRLGVSSLPTWFLVDKQARILRRGTDIDSLQTAVEAACKPAADTDKERHRNNPKLKNGNE